MQSWTSGYSSRVWTQKYVNTSKRTCRNDRKTITCVSERGRQTLQKQRKYQPSVAPSWLAEPCWVRVCLCVMGKRRIWYLDQLSLAEFGCVSVWIRKEYVRRSQRMNQCDHSIKFGVRRQLGSIDIKSSRICYRMIGIEVYWELRFGLAWRTWFSNLLACIHVHNVRVWDKLSFWHSKSLISTDTEK